MIILRVDKKSIKGGVMSNVQIIAGKRVFTTDFGAILRDREKELEDWMGRYRERIVPLSEMEKGDHLILNGPTEQQLFWVKGELEAIRAAIQRWEKGTYGICFHCGSLISESRLILVPHADSCVECYKQKRRFQPPKYYE